MTDYIERDAALKRLRPEEWGTPDEKWWPENEVAAFLRAIPAADVRPVVRGQWVDEPDSNRMCTCSLCGQWITKELSDCFNYCPTCGAEMQIKRDEALVGYIPVVPEKTEVNE